MSKNKKSGKSAKSKPGVLESAGRFANRNRRALGIAGAGVAAAAALLLGRRYRDRQAAGQWGEDGTGASAI